MQTNRRALRAVVFAVITAAAARAAAAPPENRGEIRDPWGINPAHRAQREAAPVRDEKRTTAQEKAGRALQFFDRGQWTLAYELFAEAEAIFHAPTLVLHMARCKDRMGQVFEARMLYERVVAEPLPVDPPEAWVRGHKEAEDDLVSLRRRIPSLSVTVVGLPAARISIDGTVIAAGEARDLVPGAHRVEIAAPTLDAPLVRMVDLQAGRALDLGVFVRTPPPAPPPPPPPEPLTVIRYLPAPPPPPPPPSWPAGVGGAALGLGIAGLVVGASTGGLALSRAHDLTSHCGKPCVAPGGEISAIRLLGDVSTASFVVGGVGVVTGAAILIARAARKPDAPAPPAVALRLGPLGAGVEGTF